jgi:uncharacterized protein (DUF433 family)
LSENLSARQVESSAAIRSSKKRMARVPHVQYSGGMAEWQPKPYKDYHWIVADPELLGGKLTVRGTRLSVSLILECLANGMTVDDINEAYDHAFPPEALPEVLNIASEITDKFHVAA